MRSDDSKPAMAGGVKSTIIECQQQSDHQEAFFKKSVRKSSENVTIQLKTKSMEILFSMPTRVTYICNKFNIHPFLAVSRLNWIEIVLLILAGDSW